MEGDEKKEDILMLAFQLKTILMDEKDWIKEYTQKYVSKYGEVPPHWIVYENSHPLSIRWRMGAGEMFVSVFIEWFEKNYITEEERIKYFKKYSPPPRWLAIVADLIWDLEPYNIEQEEEFDYKPYFKRLEKLGFSGTHEYEKDIDDEQWFDYE